MKNAVQMNELLKNLVDCIIKEMKRNASTPKKDIVSNELITIISNLLEEKFEVATFKNKVIDKELPSKPSAKLVIKQFYKFFIEKTHINKQDMDADAKDIKDTINKLNKRSRFFAIKKPLCDAIDTLSKVKIQLTHNNTPNSTNILENINQSITNTNAEATEEAAESLLDKMHKYLQSINQHLLTPKTDISIIKNDNEKRLEKILDCFQNKLNTFIDNKIHSLNDENQKKRLNSKFKEFCSTIKMLKRNLQLNPNDNLKIVLHKCSKACKKAYFLTGSTKQQLEDLEKTKEHKAYGFKAFEKVIDLNKKALTNARELLDSKGFNEVKIKENIISEYENLIEHKDIKLLDKKFFDKSVQAMKKIIHEEFKNIKNKYSMFGDKKPSSDKVLNTILKNLFSQSDAKNLKSEFKNSELDFSTDSHDNVINKINGIQAINSEQMQQIEKILNHRDISATLNYRNLFIKSLNASDSWKNIKKVATFGNKKFTFENSTTTGYFIDDPNVKGLSSQERQSNHSLNTWKTQVKDNNGEEIFSAIRHANTRGGENATKELIFLALLEQTPIEEVIKETKSKPQKVWEVHLGNIQLMSPVGKFNLISSDKNMPFKQMMGFKKLVDKPFDLDIINPSDQKHITIHIKLTKIILLNFGANTQHFALGGHLVKSSYSINKEALNNLFGEEIIKKLEKNKLNPNDFQSNTEEFKYFKDSKNSNDFQTSEVGKYLSNINEKIIAEPNNEKIKLKKTKIINLSKQILYIWKTTKGKGDKRDPYAIQARLALLMYLIGFPVSFNCKSGKDRTGVMNAAVNELAVELDINKGIISDPYKNLSDEEKLRSRTIYKASASDKIGQANTGVFGNKTNMHALYDRFGNTKGASGDGNTNLDKFK